MSAPTKYLLDESRMPTHWYNIQADLPKPAAIRTAVTEQGIATREIAQSIAMAASGTADVNHAVGNVARGASDTGLAAESVKEASETLSKQAVDLRGAVEAFVRSVRTGTR